MFKEQNEKNNIERKYLLYNKISYFHILKNKNLHNSNVLFHFQTAKFKCVTSSNKFIHIEFYRRILFSYFYLDIH